MNMDQLAISSFAVKGSHNRWFSIQARAVVIRLADEWTWSPIVAIQAKVPTPDGWGWRDLARLRPDNGTNIHEAMRWAVEQKAPWWVDRFQDKLTA